MLYSPSFILIHLLCCPSLPYLCTSYMLIIVCYISVLCSPSQMLSINPSLFHCLRSKSNESILHSNTSGAEFYLKTPYKHRSKSGLFYVWFCLFVLKNMPRRDSDILMKFNILIYSNIFNKQKIVVIWVTLVVFF